MFSQRRAPLVFAWFAACAAAWVPARGQDVTEPISKLRLSGFGTIGVTHAYVTQPWGFRRDASQPTNGGGTRFDTDSRLGVQANYSVSDQVELVGQVQLKRRVASAKPLDSLEWAFASYRPNPDLTIRVGRTSPDIFLLSDYRSVGFAYPWVRPDVDTYGLLPIFSVDGADITKEWNLGEVRWRAKLFAGQGSTRAPSAPGQPDIEFKFDQLFGGMVSRESNGLLLRATLGRLRGGLGSAEWKDRLQGALGQIEQLPIPQIAAEARQLSNGIDPDRGVFTYFALGASYEHDDWLVSGELVRLSSPLSYAQANTGYVSVGRRLGSVTVFGMLGAVRSLRPPPSAPQWAATLTPVVGPAQAAAIQEAGNAAAQVSDSNVDQRSVSLGMRWDLHPQVALKLQWDHYLVRPDGGVLWGIRSADPASANVVSAVLDFVF